LTPSEPGNLNHPSSKKHEITAEEWINYFDQNGRIIDPVLVKQRIAATVRKNEFLMSLLFHLKIRELTLKFEEKFGNIY
jgi:hypothetical protein